jgi:hypothetical protein
VSGGRGIRTHDGCYPIAVFKPGTGALRTNTDQPFPQVNRRIAETGDYRQ